MKKGLLGLLIIFVTIFTACDAAYNASIIGKIVDKEKYDEDPLIGGIGEVSIYIYLDEKDLDTDLAYWKETNLKPDEKPERDENGRKHRDLKKLYTDKSVTGVEGDFKFEGIWWLDFFPEFGTDASVEPAFFLFYHKDYGIVKYDRTVYLTGDGRTRTLSPFPILKQINEVILKGRVIDKNRKLNGSDLGVPGVSVDIYLPKTWTVGDSGVTVLDDDWRIDPTYNVVTDAEGYYLQTVSFPKFPEVTPEVAKTKVRVTYTSANYSLFELTDAASTTYSGYTTASGIVNYASVINRNGATVDVKDPAIWSLFNTELKKDFDLNADGNIDAYYEETLESKGNTEADKRRNIVTLNNISMRNNLLRATISGRVNDVATPGIYINAVQISAQDFFEISVQSSIETLGTATTKNVVVPNSDPAVVEAGSYSINNLAWTCYNYSGEEVLRPVWMNAIKEGGITSLPFGENNIRFSAVNLVENTIDFTVIVTP